MAQGGRYRILDGTGGGGVGGGVRYKILSGNRDTFISDEYAEGNVV